MSDRNERGATMVEFAIALPLLLMLLIGIVEAGWMFARNVDLNHATREGTRLAVVNYPEYDGSASPGVRTTSNTDTLVDAICSEISLSSNAFVTVQSPGARDDVVQVAITSEGDTLTEFLDWIVPEDFEIESTSSSRVEQAATWANVTDDPCD